MGCANVLHGGLLSELVRFPHRCLAGFGFTHPPVNSGFRNIAEREAAEKRKAQDRAEERERKAEEQDEKERKRQKRDAVLIELLSGKLPNCAGMLSGNCADMLTGNCVACASNTWLPHMLCVRDRYVPLCTPCYNRKNIMKRQRAG